MTSTISSKTLSELYKYLQSNGGSYNDLKNSFKNSDIEADESIASNSSRNKDVFLDKYIRSLDLSERPDIFKLINFIELVITFPPSPESANLVEGLRQDGWQIIGNHIVQSAYDVQSMLSSMMQGQPIETIQREWDRALLSIHNDPADALTAASSMIEATFKFILHDAGVSFPSKQDIQGLSKTVYPLLDISPERETDTDFRALFQSTISIVQSLGTIRTKIGDAHGASPSRVEPAEKHARLATNMAGALCFFLLETYIERKDAGVKT
jgi:hypothetical protein